MESPKEKSQFTAWKGLAFGLLFTSPLYLAAIVCVWHPNYGAFLIGLIVGFVAGLLAAKTEQDAKDGK